MSGQGTDERLVRVEARPEYVEIDLLKTALIIVDMQNVFAGRGETALSQDTSGVMRVIERTKQLADAARAASVSVIYLSMIKDPERKGKSIIKSPRDTKIVDELTPLPTDVVIEKICYSGFRGTILDEVLKRGGKTHLLITGTATNVCVESTLRDAYFLDYRPILVADATHNAGPSFTQQATEWNVEEAFGWVATTADVLEGLSGDGVRAV
jgi:ureidoacrylate peracid hydrolase